ncbi:hypothetical protein ACFYYB_36565 [Streptomyces sp. NPDC002886]|uniref:hypothetical protein n=1 Tax=Streptomyces sp. NPDC002886 TaxID=3364667 RepID=UPI0036B936B8
MKSLIVVSSSALSLMAFGAVGAESVEGEPSATASPVGAPFAAGDGITAGNDWGWS